MSNGIVLHHGITCPDCGGKNAVIIAFCMDEKIYYSHAIEHSSCGHVKRLETLVNETKKTNGITSLDTNYLGKNGDISVKVQDSSFLPNYVAAIKELQSRTNNFYKKVIIKMETKPLDLTCPICGGTEYNTDINYAYCINKHYQMDLDDYFELRLERFYEVSFVGQNTYLISLLSEERTPFQKLFPKMFPVKKHFIAKLILRTIKYRNKYKKALVSDSMTQSPEEYLDFQEILNALFGEIFIIIQKKN